MAEVTGSSSWFDEHRQPIGRCSSTATVHGGRLIAARAAFPDAPAPFVDLSTGISPFAYPFAMPPHAAFARLPEPEQEWALRTVAALAYGAPGADQVAVAPGSQMLIGLLPRTIDVARAVVLGPTYAEHAAAWRRAGVVVEEVATPEALLDAAGPGTVSVLCNPNNPDGRRLDLAALRRLAARGGWLVVDEAYADLEPEPAAAASLLAETGRIVVLRSFGKGYGLAGVRLGFLLAAPALVLSVMGWLGPWAVGGVALAIGRQALSDRDWRDRTALLAAQAADRLDHLLRGSGLDIVGGTRLFRLAGVADADRLWRHLARGGILVRRFEADGGRLRFGLPADEAAWGRLAARLAR